MKKEIKFMICPNCGRELAEGEVCNCQQPQQEAVNQEPQQNNYYQPEPQNYYQPEQQAYYSPEQQPQQPQQPQGNNYYYPNDAQYYAPVGKPKARTDYPEGYKIKKKYVAVLLGVTLGLFGIHNFYLGNTNKAIGQIVLTVVGGLLFGIGTAASLIWAIVETALILTEETDADANGFKIQTFAEELNSQNK
jgi:TM2 domain-containing membrane protein YozV